MAISCFVAGGGSWPGPFSALTRRAAKVAWKGESDRITHADARSPADNLRANDRSSFFHSKGGLVSVQPEDGKVLWRYTFSLSNFDGSFARCGGRTSSTAPRRMALGRVLPRITKEGEQWKSHGTLAQNPVTRFAITGARRVLSRTATFYGVFGSKQF